ncbi:MAG TPA: antibiotic biosynthesis monooxygenase [Chryseolinea sp.]|nr:antibiotic biosynthesis monooxygenase [Chryseolinea sp.]HPM29400.1 antibiotic biosynthesis monooxygenase [Chryseolinea sp.]
MKLQHYRLLVWMIIMVTLSFQDSFAQDKTSYMRIAKITVDSVKLPDYLIALKTQMESALKYEEGVLAYSAVQDKNNPTRITIFETYASVAAYQSHILTGHFKKYKTTVADKVKQLELIDVIPIAIQSKHK